MAIVTSSFTITGQTTWATSTWADNDSNPSYKVDDQLSAWVSAINDANKISIIKKPGDLTARGTSDSVQWLLRCRDQATGDYGFNFLHRPAGAGTSSSTSGIGTYHTWSDTSSNNGAGTYTSIGTAYYAGITDPMSYLTSYEATGTTPWFAISMTNSAKTVRYTYLLLRLDTTNLTSGSYYPTSDLGKWNYVFFGTPITPDRVLSPQSSFTSPQKGTGDSASYNLSTAIPTYDNYFFPLRSQFGQIHWMGQPTKDILISKGTTGAWGDTVQISNTIYTSVGTNNGSTYAMWIKTGTV